MFERRKWRARFKDAQDAWRTADGPEARAEARDAMARLAEVLREPQYIAAYDAALMADKRAQRRAGQPQADMEAGQ